MLDDLRQALAEYYPKVRSPQTPIIRYGSWIGGDRDGNPFVTPEITRQTLTMLRGDDRQAPEPRGGLLARSLSISDRQTPPPTSLVEAVQRAGETWPELAAELDRIAPLETYRRWLYVVQWRLRRTAQVSLDEAAGGASPAGALRRPTNCSADVQLVADALAATGNQTTAEVDVQPWLDQIRVFGFHTARLDVRQHSGVYRDAFAELWQRAGRTATAIAKRRSTRRRASRRWPRRSIDAAAAPSTACRRRRARCSRCSACCGALPGGSAWRRSAST